MGRKAQTELVPVPRALLAEIGTRTQVYDELFAQVRDAYQQRVLSEPHYEYFSDTTGEWVAMVPPDYHAFRSLREAQEWSLANRVQVRQVFSREVLDSRAFLEQNRGMTAEQLAYIYLR